MTFGRLEGFFTKSTERLVVSHLTQAVLSCRLLSLTYSSEERFVVRIAVLGAGAIGSVVGGYLAAAGNDVALINIDEDYVSTVNADGLVVKSVGVEQVVRVRAVASSAGLQPVDLLVVLVKSFHTEKAMRSSTNLLHTGTMVMSLQNGLGQEDVLAEIVGKANVIAGKTYIGGMMVGPGRVAAGVEGKETIIGELDGQMTRRIQDVAETFNKAKLTTVVTNNIMGAMWDKLLINVAAGALSGITGLNFGNLYDLPEVEEAAIEAVAEAMKVASALGIQLETKSPRDAWIKASAGLSFDFKPSVLQALEMGMITEIDFINGAVVRAGRKAGIPTPVNATLVACMKGVERALYPKTEAQNQAG